MSKLVKFQLIILSNEPSLEIPMAAPSSPATINSSQLANLETLHNAGILTDEEYNCKLRQLNNP